MDVFDDRGATWQVVAHRGRCGSHPENAVEALDHLPGTVDGVEIDVRLSADHVPVLMHDATALRTTGVDAAIAELPLETIRELEGPDGARVPTLGAYLQACAGRDLDPILVDAKAAGPRDIAEVVPVVAGSEVAGRCILMVRSDEEMAGVREHSSSLRLGAFGTTVENVGDRLAAAERHGAELVLVEHGDEAYLRNRDAVATARTRGLCAGASTINALNALEAARSDRCDLVITDSGDRLVRPAREPGAR